MLKLIHITRLGMLEYNVDVSKHWFNW